MNKEELEEKKIRLEIEELQKSWYLKPDILKVFLPTTLAILSLVYAISSGLFSSKNELLELKKQQLQFEISQFQKEKRQLVETNQILESKRQMLVDSIENQALKLASYEDALLEEKDRIGELNSELASLKNTRNDYKQEIRNLKDEFEGKKQVYLKELESTYFKEGDLRGRVEQQKRKIESLNAETSRLKYNLGLVDAYPFVEESERLKFKDWIAKKMIEYLALSSAKSDEEIKKTMEALEKAKKKTDSLKVELRLLEIELTPRPEY